MPIDAILSELKSMYPRGLEGADTATGRLGSADIDRWSATLAMPRAAFYDLLALRLASGFYRDEFPFSFCDRIVNDIHGVITLADEARPDLFWSVFSAFDAGEFNHGNNRNEDPVAKYTRPLIAQVLAKHANP